MTSFYARLRTPPQDVSVKVASSRRGGVRLEFGERHLFLTVKLARQLADALVDAAERGESTCPPPVVKPQSRLHTEGDA